ncbi:MAG: GntR family transcriptional regulator [Acidimicrobiales bacterium]
MQRYALAHLSVVPVVPVVSRGHEVARSQTRRDSDNVYGRLKREIMEGRFAPGAHLPENELAERLGVSRTPIREALGRLERDGLVVATSRGMGVRERSPEEILEIYEARIMLEAAVARAAAQRRSATDIVRLDGLLKRSTTLAGDDPSEMARSNLTFHEAVWGASHNATLADLLMRLNVHLTRYPATTLARAGRWKEALAEHAQIVGAIKRGDADAAADIASTHFRAARDIRLAMWTEELEGGE